MPESGVIRMTARGILFRTGLAVYLVGLAALLARQHFSFHFFVISLFYPISDWALWALASGAGTAAVVGLAVLATARRKQRKRVWLGWAFMVAVGVATAVAVHR